jgi:hypothetical protein
MVLRELIPDFGCALNAEIVEARRQGGASYRIFDGQALESVADGFLYRFRLEAVCPVPDECGVAVRATDEEIDDVVVAIEELDIVLSLERPLAETRRARMIVKLWYILEKLRDRLSDARLTPSCGPTALFQPSGAKSEWCRLATASTLRRASCSSTQS